MNNGRVSDKAIAQKIQQRLARTGMSSQTRVTVTVRNGAVTISGNLQYEMQRSHALTAVRGVAGVRQVTDQMQFKVQARKWQEKH